MLKTEIKILNHGYVKLRNLSGPTRRGYQDEGQFNFNTGRIEHPDRPFDADDTDPANTARVSFDNLDGGRSRADDLKLYEYLVSHEHNTPVEMIETWWEIKVPMFIGEQILRHRTASVNKVSGRYTTLPEEFYIPEVVRGKAKSNKQGSEDNLPFRLQEEFKKDLELCCDDCYEHYSHYLAEGVAPELARCFLHSNHFTYFVYKQDLHNLMHFLALRLDNHAQWEVQVVAEAMYQILKDYLPKSMELFDTYKRKLTDEEKYIFRKYINENAVAEEADVVHKVLNRLGIKL